MRFLTTEIAFTVEGSFNNPEEIKTIIAAEFNGRLPGNKIKRYWEANTFIIKGLGADGQIELLSSKVQVLVKLKPPLSFMRETIEKNLHEIIIKATTNTAQSNQKELLNWLYSNINGGVTDGVFASQQYLSNFGHIFSFRPKFIIKPNDVQSILTMLEFANKNRLSVSVRGAAHSQTKHGISDNNILLDMKGLNRIIEINSHEKFIWVEAGITWSELVNHTYRYQLIPPVLTNNLEATVGGTLSIAGVGVSSFKYGTQCDNVEALEVILADGTIIQCSPADNSDIFWGVLSGLGQIGIITKAKLRLRQIKPNVRSYQLLYTHLEKLCADVKIIMQSNKIDYLESWASPCIQGFKVIGDSRKPFARWFYPLHISVEYDAESLPNDAEILKNLNYFEQIGIIDQTTKDFSNRLSTVFDIWKQLNTWEFMHPWMEAVLPQETSMDYIDSLLADLPPSVNLGGHVLVWPVPSSVSKTPLFIRPQSDFLIGFGILAAVPPAHWPNFKSRLDMASELSIAMGGKRYLSGYLSFTQKEWKEHYGDQWDKFVALKRKYDPKNLLNPDLIPLLE